MTWMPPPVPWQASGADPAHRVGPRPAVPTRSMVASQVFLRSLALAVLGGLAIGVVLGTTIVIWDGIANPGSLIAFALLLGPVVGAVFGCALGIVAGIVLAPLSLAVLVPERTWASARLIARIAAVSAVALFFAGCARWFGDPMLWSIVGGMGAAGALVFAPFLVGWYFRAVGEAHDS